MKVILLKDVKSQGKKDNIIDVSDGYANNYLIKNKLAVAYTEGSKKVLDYKLKEQKEQEEIEIQKCNDIKSKLENIKLEFKVKTGKSDQVFGSISTKQIADKLMQQGFKIDKKCIYLNDNIDTLGNHIVEIKLHKKVEFKINIYLTK